MKLETFGIRRGVSRGCTHSAVITTTSLRSPSFIQTLSSPFPEGLQTPTTAQGNFCSIHHHTHGSHDKHSALPFRICLLRRYCELQKAYDRHNSAYHNPAEKEIKQYLSNHTAITSINYTTPLSIYVLRHKPCTGSNSTPSNGRYPPYRLYVVT
jgi:GrpB-like predicted nucleotidyltransferase (UPF0157 family)